MELQVGEYHIPSGCTIKRVGNIIRVYKKRKLRLSDGEYRCNDCKYYVSGHATYSRFTTMICKRKIKPHKPLPDYMRKQFRFDIYYSANQYGKPCDKFELKN